MKPEKQSQRSEDREFSASALHNRGKDAHPVQDPLIEILIHAFRHFYYAIHA